MTLIIIIVAVLVLKWWIERPVPKTPQELEREKQEDARREAEFRRIVREQQAEEEARREEWRSKYKQYLRSDKWKRVRKRVLDEADHTCAICGRPATHVHHKKYTRGHSAGEFKREKYEYLVPLCASCHMDQHGL